MRDLHVVIPAYNEERMVGEVVTEVRARCRHVIVVDDGSSDHTADVAREAGAVAIRHAVNCGQGASLATGIAYALERGARAIVTFDADGQHDADDIPRLLAPLERGEADVVLGSRFLDGRPAMPATRRWLLAAAIAFTRMTSRLPVTDAHNGLRAMTAEAARAIDLRLPRSSHASEFLDQIRAHGLRFCEIAVTIRYSGYSLGKGQTSHDAVGIAVDYLLGKLEK